VGNIVCADTFTSAGNNEAGMDEALVMFFAVELFRTVESLHACEILHHMHGDVKPDNCLVRFDTPTSPTTLSPEPSLIDLGDNTDPREVSYSLRGLFDWRKKGLTLIGFGRAENGHK
jgi:checkpoint serine/threonine-protein kinase